MTVVPDAIIHVQEPVVDDGRWPAKAVAGTMVAVFATVFPASFGVACSVTMEVRSPSGVEFAVECERDNAGLDGWAARLDVDLIGLWHFRIRADVHGSRPVRTNWYPLLVERDAAASGSWYIMFPRSEGAEGGRSGTFRTAERSLEHVAEMGFDVVLLPPIHPIGRTGRKGPDNSERAAPGDPGSPWAVGGSEGGHFSIHPDLGTAEDFRHFVSRAQELGIEVALDIAMNCSPDHPWVREHPSWFAPGEDGRGTVATVGEKAYSDLVAFAAAGPVREELVTATIAVLEHWIAHCVKIFRVDVPHGKSLGFWHEVLCAVRVRHPDVVFLAETQTRPAYLHWFAKIGFSQSYTYYPWRLTRVELESYLIEVTERTRHFLRPNFFAGTPDYLCPYLVAGGEVAFRIRAAIAALGVPSWGIPAGYEFAERLTRGDGTPQHGRSEKYEYRPRDRANAPLTDFLATLNGIRRAHPCLRRPSKLTVLDADDADVLAFRRALDDDLVVVVVNLDPARARAVTVRLGDGCPGWPPCRVRDVLTGATLPVDNGRVALTLAPPRGSVAVLVKAS